MLLGLFSIPQTQAEEVTTQCTYDIPDKGNSDYLTDDKNPRCGIGQIAPGHFVAILADGRQDNYSNGLTLTQFAELFIEEGCTMAYNLDGGVSTCKSDSFIKEKRNET